MGFLDRLTHAWNAFIGEDEKRSTRYPDYGYGSFYRPDRTILSRGNERSIITSIYTRMAIDVSSINIRHVKLDDRDRYIENVDSYLDYCLKIEANKDQQSRAFMLDVVMSLFDEGSVAIVPIDTNRDIDTGAFDIMSMRTAKIVQWYPDHIQVNVYNDQTGKREDLTFPKSKVAILENPFYSVMNEKNSILQRLIRKLNLLDVIDEQSGSGKLDLIIQLPYVVKSDARREQADKRRKDIEEQLTGSKYGIAYTDGTEKITQLNRSVENNLLKQIEYLMSMLFSQLGVTQSVLDGTADEKTMLNYMNRTIEPIISTIVLEMDRKFISKTARTQKQALKYFNDPFKLTPMTNLADIADKFTRNEILSSNEIRQLVGFMPVNDPAADELRNKNLNPAKDAQPSPTVSEETNVSKEE